MSLEWATFLRRTRRSLGWSQARLAEESAKYTLDGKPISVAWISSMERNQSHAVSGASANPSVDVAVALGLAMNVDEDEARVKAGYSRRREQSEPAGGLGAITLIIPPYGPDVTVVSGNGVSTKAPRELFEGAASQARGVLVRSQQ